MNEQTDFTQHRFVAMRALATPILILLASGGPLMAQPVSKDGETKGNYAEVNGLKMYYEIHGTGSNNPPLVLLHGAFGFAEGWGAVLPTI
jgi:hypothetical protein